MNLQNAYNRFLELSGSLDNLMQFQQEINSEKEHNGEKILGKISKGVRLENVYLRYDKNIVLKNINLKINLNETIAFVGESGSGKQPWSIYWQD